MRVLLSVSLLIGLASATFPGSYYGGSGYIQSLPPRITSLTMTFPYGNPFRPGENYVDLGRTGPYYLGNRFRGYTIYPTYGISNTYNRLFGSGSPFGGLTSGSLGLIGGNNYGGNPFGGYPTGNIGGGLLGGPIGRKKIEILY